MFTENLETMKETKITPDNVLVRQYIAGNDAAIETLIKRHKEKIFTSILIFTKDRYLAEDLFQNLWIKTIKKLKAGKYNEEGKFLPWMMRMSYNACVDSYRKGKRKPKNIPIEGFDFNLTEIITDGNLTPEKALLQEERDKKVRDLINELPDNQKEVILLRHYYDFKFKDIAELTGVSINTALGRMRYTLINLRKIIEEKNIQL